MAGKKKPSGERHWPAPVLPSDVVFREFCSDWKINPTKRAQLHSRLEELVNYLSIFLSDVRSNKSLKDMRADLEHILSSLAKARERLEAMKSSSRIFRELPAGMLSLASIAAIDLSSLLDADFLARIAGNSPPAHRQDPYGKSSRRAWAHRAIQENCIEVLCESVQVLHQVMEFSLSVIKANSKGGRPSYTLGRILLFNVSIIYIDFAPGRPEPSAGSGGEFIDFAVQLVRAIGLPTGWIEGQLRHVIPLWKEWNAQPPAPNRHVDARRV